LGRSLSQWDPHQALSELDEAVQLNSENNTMIHEELRMVLGRLGDPYAAIKERDQERICFQS
jgi:hypothetical protein